MTVSVLDRLQSESSGESAVRAVECLLFVAGEPLGADALARAMDVDAETVVDAVRLLRDRYAATDSALQVLEIAGGYQLSTRPELGSLIGNFLAPHANRLSRPALDTVTIVAYRQPVTQAEVEAIRGVASDGILKKLIERDLVIETGRKQTPGRPILYGTTDGFLHYFGLSALSDLPALAEDDDALTSEAMVALAAAGAMG